MKVTHQKNVYYLDLNKNLYRGYVETSLSRESHEKYITYKSSHLEIEEVILLETSEPMEIEHYNTKHTKDKAKNAKLGAKIKIRKNPNIYGATSKHSADLSILNPNANLSTRNNDFSCITTLYNNDTSNNSTVMDTSDMVAVNNDAGELAFFDAKAFIHDAFRIKIPENCLDSNIKVRIVFKPSPDNPAILWYRPVSNKDKHKEVVACNFYNNSSSAAPYIDTITNVDLYYVIPNIEEVKVVSSGSFKSIKEEDKMIIYLYSAFSHPKYFMFAVGTYNQSDIFNDNDQRKMLIPYIMTAEGISTDHSEVQNDLQALIKYIEGFTKTQELSTCNIVFSLIDVENLVAKNMVVLKYTYLPSQRDIEMAYFLKKILSESLCQQVYHFLNWSAYDSWIYFGFSGYLSDYCIRYLLGNNEFLYNYFEDKQFVVNEDVHEYPLFYTFRKESEVHSEFFRKKARLVFHSMEANLSFAFLQKISDELIELRSVAKDSGSASSNSSNANSNIDVPTSNNSINNGANDSSNTHSIWAISNAEISSHTTFQDLKRCFTPRFIKIVKDATGKDLRSFFDFYVFRPGLMRVKLQFQINKKKNSVKVNASYTSTSLLPGANKRLLGNVDIKSVELEGGFDHSIAFGNENVFYYHTRTKKKKKDDEEETMPLLYIRVDPKRLNIFEYTVEQPDYMHIEQLQDKSVIGQLEAIYNLGTKPSLSSCEALERLLDNFHIFYKIRAKIAYILRSIKIEDYDGLQRIIQYFIRTYCVPNSTILKSNEFGLISYFIQKHLVDSISQINFKEECVISNSKIVLAFLENILKFNDNSLSQFEDSWYVANAINLFCIHTCFLMCYNSPASESERVINSIAFSSGNDVDFGDVVGHIDSTFHKNINYTANYAYDTIRTNFNEAEVANMNTSINKSDKNNANCEQLLSRCISELERFRISDMVFPSNNNIITKICILSYIRLAFYNKVSIKRSTLENLCRYPNLHSVRFVAIEGLILLFSDALPFVLSLALEETSFVAKSILGIILRIMLLNLRVHLLDTNEYEVNLTERLRVCLSKCTETLYSIYKHHPFHVGIADLVQKMFSMIEGKFLILSDYSEYIISKYDYARENDNRLSILKMPSATKRIRISNFQELRIAAFEESYTLRLPRIKNFRSKTIKDSVPLFKCLKIRLTPPRYLVKHTNEYIIRFKIKKTKIRVKKSDIALMLINKYRENKGSEKIDECISKSKPTGFFQWDPLTSDQILEVVHTHKMPADGQDEIATNLTYVQVFQEVEKSLIFVLSYNLVVSKMYQTAKSLYSYIEYVFLNNAFIKEKIRPMTEESRRICGGFLERLKDNPSYAAFCYPVDTTELKNYADIVRHPVSFHDIEANLSVYQSIDAFIISLERICSNCLKYNDSRSVIAGMAQQLQKEIDSFKKEQTSIFESPLINSVDVIRNIIASFNIEHLFDSTIQNIAEIRSWGDLENELNRLKKKYSRTSHNGKLITSSIRLIKEQLKNWFLYDGVRVLMMPE
ncbi:uncharacterized protein VICG_01070 [Vittaforma corneae ATCC 50505]|uniref:Bromo domain-containing protein n=1 Tax=Vittaforma corneae (strain ATCC 50505) TaxID=993615 RepID=L2GM15_VITCO|nr:uncharacterized protein VICG_01070 [Vittaforma corneae ATCC 50505]ELA41886.1 hypothetical protein VICG_01070 [Vittaforma corneae ATCC 50505]